MSANAALGASGDRKGLDGWRPRGADRPREPCSAVARVFAGPLPAAGRRALKHGAFRFLWPATAWRPLGRPSEGGDRFKRR